MIRGYLAAVLKALVFDGRADRAEFWSFTGVNLAVVSCLAVIDQQPVDAAVEPGVGIASGLFFVVLCVPQTAVMIRRLHDTDRSAWWVIIAGVPFVGVFVLLAMASVAGDRQPNRYGPSPRDARADAES